MVNARTLQQKYKPHLELPENSVPGLYKAQYTNWTYGSERLRDLHNPEIENPETGMFQTGKQTKRKICLEIFIIAFFNDFCMLKILAHKTCPNRISKQVWIYHGKKLALASVFQALQHRLTSWAFKGTDRGLWQTLYTDRHKYGEQAKKAGLNLFDSWRGSIILGLNLWTKHAVKRYAGWIRACIRLHPEVKVCSEVNIAVWLPLALIQAWQLLPTEYTRWAKKVWGMFCHFWTSTCFSSPDIAAALG